MTTAHTVKGTPTNRASAKETTNQKEYIIERLGFVPHVLGLIHTVGVCWAGKCSGSSHSVNAHVLNGLIHTTGSAECCAFQPSRLWGSIALNHNAPASVGGQRQVPGVNGAYAEKASGLCQHKCVDQHVTF